MRSICSLMPAVPAAAHLAVGGRSTDSHVATRMKTKIKRATLHYPIKSALAAPLLGIRHAYTDCKGAGSRSRLSLYAPIQEHGATTTKPVLARLCAGSSGPGALPAAHRCGPAAGAPAARGKPPACFPPACTPLQADEVCQRSSLSAARSSNSIWL